MLTGEARAVALEWLMIAAALVWLWAGAAKLWRPFTRADVEALAPGLGALHPGLRWVVPGAELAIGAALLLGTQARTAGFAGAALAGLFAVLHVRAMVQAGLADTPLAAGCGCFGQSRAATVPAGPGRLDLGALQARGWTMARAAVLALATWTATLPCAVCG